MECIRQLPALETPSSILECIPTLLRYVVISLISSLIYCISSDAVLQLDPSVTLFEYGLVVAADAAAQMLLSPFIGLIIDK